MRDRVLVRNLTPRGGTGKLGSFWEDNTLIIVDDKMDVILRDDVPLPIFKIKAKNNSGGIRIPHGNMIKECNNLPSERSTGTMKTVKVKKKEKTKTNHSEVEESDSWMILLHL